MSMKASRGEATSEVGARLRKIREAKGLPLHEVANFIGVSESTVDEL